MIEILALVPTNRIKHAYHETLDVVKVMRVPIELREVLANINFGVLDFRLQEIGLVEEDHYGDVSEAPIIDDSLKYIETLDESIGDSVLQ